MNIFIARQPIFDKSMQVYGYELLYREAGQNAYCSSDGDMASLNVISAGFLSLGLNTLTGDKKAFINFTDNLLTQEIATLLPTNYLVIEVLETVAPSDEIISACKRLKSIGHMIALDDFVFKPGYGPLVELADIIKIDFLASSDKEKEDIIQRFGKRKIKFLAEKIETQEEFQKAVHMGYTYFQGYFFSKPVILSASTIPASKLNHIRLINAINIEDPDFRKLANIIETDASFSYEILRIVNSVFFSRGIPIKSIRQALIRLGIEELRKWCHIAVLRKLGEDQHKEVINICMIRAKFLEMVSKQIGMQQRSSEFMTVGILSMLDVLSGCPMEKVLEEISLSDEVKDTLMGKNCESRIAWGYKLVLECEKGHWQEAIEISKELGVQIEKVADSYYEAVRLLVKITQEIS